MNRNRITGAARDLADEVGGRLRSVAGGARRQSAAQFDDLYDDAVAIGERTRGHAADLADEALTLGRQAYGRGMQELTHHAGRHPVALILAAGIAGAALAWLCSSASRR
ncbi:hypothetical protein J2X65_001717 [Ancylobacter sp. 3268]|uniref:hypothetical protein n=1 Tax=Ancylobacter sp. 3268 TaxID=2817752 RepID=UPI00285C6CB1|nr:hypothetical protein [Ancylobacter sp. 3268]MDR6952362.1 hypothetical protein [Ancylobacter sp. 3268]